MEPSAAPLAVLAARDLDGFVLQVAPWARAFARVLPTATLVPALAMRGAPAPLRGAIAVALAAPLAGAFGYREEDGALALILLGDVLAGLPLAVAIATPLWMATHVGAIADIMRGTPEANVAPPPAAEGARGPLATLSALLAASAWIGSGGVARALLLLRGVGPGDGVFGQGVAPWALAARALADGIRISLALSAGVLIAAATLEAGIVAIGRVAAPVPVQPLAMLARPIVAVVALALSIELAVLTLVR